MGGRTLGVAVFVAAQAAALALVAAPAPALPRLDPAGVTVHPADDHGVTVDTGTTVGAGLARLVATEPVTILDARPWRTDAGVELRAAHGLLNGAPLRLGPRAAEIRGGFGFACTRRRAPYGHAIHPLPGLRLAAGDRLWLVFSLRAAAPGEYTAAGYVVTYRTDDGRTHTAAGDGATFRLASPSAGSPADLGLCPLARDAMFVEPPGGGAR